MSVHTVVLHLSLIETVGPATIEQVVHYCRNNKIDLIDLYCFTTSDFVRMGIAANKAKVLQEGLACTQRLETTLRTIEQNNWHWVTVLDESYPYLLRHISYAPPVLYWQGAHLCDALPSLAVIGSRDINHYGVRTLQFLIPDLVQQGWTIVSGGARGADSIAHDITLQNKGKTVAVLGSGLLHWYPTSNRSLFERIIAQGGTIVSSFSLDTPAHSHNFPIRNRLIAGLSYGCVVIQAAQESGTRITALHALEQSKEVFAVPGAIDDRLSAGCHELIKEGATLVCSAEDIKTAFAHKQFRPRSCKQCTIQSPQMVSKRCVQQPVPLQNDLKEDAVASSIITLCTTAQPLDALIEHTGLSIGQISEQLYELSLKGIITQNALGMWIRAS